MALIEVNMMSQKLLRPVTFTAIIPADKWTEEGNIKEQTFKTLYLLHGGFGNHLDYITGTRIARWAEDNNLAVIMPAGENRFYVDKPEQGEYYGAFVAEELVDVTRRMFPLSRKREDTFIAGLSMGGYGALVNGLKYHERFSWIGTFSPALLNEIILLGEPENNIIELWKPGFYEHALGSLDTLLNSDKDYYYLMSQLIKHEEKIPNIFMAIGTEDFLLEPTRKYYQFLIENEIPVTYKEEPGSHNWEYWDKILADFLECLPLEELEVGFGSGHVISKTN
ncbi:alpha/beta hydrolase [Vagococcus fluvialis]|uniref:alpha/beta hydrolase n=1 Tax=Vagococcus fluvialis TaxID=2738 RepID=UPI001A8F9743|nr:alpha/beta hydrolase-fold protein [Vagococcus fluvialis]MBO0443343.1 acetylesterase [Vagococcus fluvialis]